MQSDLSSGKHVILCLNSGSSSLKFSLYRLAHEEEVRLAHGAVERIGLSGGRLWIQGQDNKALVDVQRDFPDFAVSADSISAAAKDIGFPSPVAAGHRLVYGGPNHSASERVDAAFLKELHGLIPFA